MRKNNINIDAVRVSFGEGRVKDVLDERFQVWLHGTVWGKQGGHVGLPVAA
jgi:hypothetical protein